MAKVGCEQHGHPPQAVPQALESSELSTASEGICSIARALRARQDLLKKNLELERPCGSALQLGSWGGDDRDVFGLFCFLCSTQLLNSSEKCLLTPALFFPLVCPSHAWHTATSLILTDDRCAHLCWHPGEEQWGFLGLQSPFCFSSRKAREWGWGDLGSEYSVSLMFSAYLLPSLLAPASQYHPPPCHPITTASLSFSILSPC